jgi:4a-hydroxytetrahydrobiopterin dehydratase
MATPRLLQPDELQRQLADLVGWRLFTAGIHASYDAPDFPTAVRLVGEIGDAAETMNHHPDVDLRWRTVRLTCSTHSAGGVTQLDVELAHQIQTAARAAGAVPGAPPAPTPVRGWGWELGLDAVDPVALRPFWREALGYVEATMPDGTIELQDPAGVRPPLWFQEMDPPRTDRDRFHLDVYREGEEAPALRDRLLDLGGRLVDDSHAPHWWVLADPEGNLACVCTA